MGRKKDEGLNELDEDVTDVSFSAYCRPPLTSLQAFHLKPGPHIRRLREDAILCPFAGPSGSMPILSSAT